MSWGDEKDLAVLFAVIMISSTTTANIDVGNHNFECGPHGFICEGTSKLRICEGGNRIGPSFLCPAGTLCNEDSSDVCDDITNYIDSSLRDVRCRRKERIADSSVPDCKGYILCIPNRNRFQGIKFKCTGTTIFNGYTRTCTTPDKYRCPMANSSSVKTDYDGYESRQSVSAHHNSASQLSHGNRPIDCKNYNFKVTEDRGPVRATYFCPSRPEQSGAPTKCTVFSNEFCIMLDRDEQDSFVQAAGAANRKPRSKNLQGPSSLPKLK